MPTYYIIDKANPAAAKIMQYDSEAGPLEVAGYPFNLYDHVEQPAPAPGGEPAVIDRYDALIDVGPFYDRFGLAKAAVLKSQNADVMAIREDVKVRAYIDLRRQDVQAAIAAIAALVPEVTAEILVMVKRQPVQRHENARLRASGIEV